MSDDLDDFFEEVAEVEAKAKDVEEGEDDHHEHADGQLVGGKDSHEKHDGGEDESPPAKKLKVAAAAAPPRPVIPRGIVVAAAASSSSSNHRTTKTSQQDGEGPNKNAGSFGTDRHPHTNSPIGPSAPQSFSKSANVGCSAPPLPPPPPPLPPPLPPGPPPNMQHLGEESINNQNIDDWPKDGFRLFVGNLTNEVDDTILFEHFAAKYKSLQRARVIRDAKKNSSKGFGFISFADPLECARAKREMDQTWICSRPIRIKKYQGNDSNNSNNKQGKGVANKKNNKNKR